MKSEDKQEEKPSEAPQGNYTDMLISLIWIDLQNYYWLNGTYEKKGETGMINNSTNITKKNQSPLASNN